MGSYPTQAGLNFLSSNDKGIINSPSALVTYKHAAICTNTGEVLMALEARAVGERFAHISSVLKNALT